MQVPSSPTAITGGIVGVLIQGLKRAAFSNEAGVGSAAIAHAAVRTSEPLTEGYVAMLGPFIDTVIICTMTAMVIVITGAYNIDGVSGVALTSSAFQSVFPWFGTLLAGAVLLFAFSTMISWSYYGLKCWTYLFGESKGSELTYKVIFLYLRGDRLQREFGTGHRLFRCRHFRHVHHQCDWTIYVYGRTKGGHEGLSGPPRFWRDQAL